jgi:thiosulfate/3-mercaptopyruvate sulfurtransferase
MKRRDFLRQAAGWASLVAVEACRSSARSTGAAGSTASEPAPAASESFGAPFPWTADRFVEPADLAAALDAAAPPTIVNVGPEVLYRRSHVPGAEYAGEGRSAEGIEQLAKHVSAWPREKRVVVYCGCCPWKNCPNIRPAYSRLQALGFKDVRVLDLPVSFRVNWVQKGLPVAQG